MQKNRLGMGLRTKLVLITVGLLIAAVAVSGFLSYRTARDGVIKIVSQDLQASAEVYGEMVDIFLEQLNTDVLGMAQHPVLRNPAATRTEIDAVLWQYLDMYDWYFDIAFTDADGLQIANTLGFVDVDKSDLGWFIDARDGKTHISSLRISRDLGKPVVNCAAPVYAADGRLAGVVMTRLNPEISIWRIVDGYAQKQAASGRPTAYAYMIDANGVFIAHPDRNMILQDDIRQIGVPELVDAGNRMIRGESGVVAYTFRGIPKHVGYAPLRGFGDYKGQGWSLAAGIDDHEFLAPVVAIRNAALLVGGVVTAMGLVVVLVFATGLTTPIYRMIREVERVAEGDLTRQIDIKSRDEIGRLAGAFNQMIDSLKALVGQVNASSANLAAQSQEISASSEEVGSTMDHVAGSTSEVAATAEQASAGAQSLTESAQVMQEVALSGGKAVADTIQKIEAIRQAAQDTANNITELESRSHKVAQITGAITDIADQTNLLALNAAIEAARAGEHGRGFAVVAEEVRKLAEQSAGAAKEISIIIDEIRRGMDTVGRSTEVVATAVTDGVETAARAGEQIKEIVTRINENVRMIEEIAQGSAQTSSATQNLTASIQEVSSTMEQLTSAAQELAEMADKLAGLVGRFRV